MLCYTKGAIMRDVIQYKSLKHSAKKKGGGKEREGKFFFLLQTPPSEHFKNIQEFERMFPSGHPI